MKLSDAKKYLPFVQAAAEGKVLEWRWASMPNSEWAACQGFYDWFCTSDDRLEFRIKPEPKLRPWRPEEVPVGALVRLEHGDRRMIQLITQSEAIGCYIGAAKVGQLTNYQILCDFYEHSLNHGKTWLLCGVQE